ncbi:MAG TPA: TauD/TfdA family dioxygenase, partial [Burkholderiales bacterium]|nr:TauD/TfdA family dioxygenase [Burkholderiales bacterium]
MLELKPLGPRFAAEVHGIALTDVAAGADVYRRVRAAFEDHSVLLFRDQRITDDIQVAFSQRFGPLEIAKAASLGEGTPFSILTNIDRTTGLLVPDDHKEALRARANQLWHTDSCFKAPPALASVLSARIIPTRGGETEFASMRCAWERLPEPRRAQLADAYAWHDYAHSRGKIAAHLASARERESLPPVCWRIRWRNPVNGRDSLYVASHTCAIGGLPAAAAQALLAELIEFITAP